MFTGLVEDTGTILSVAVRGTGRELVIRTGIPMDEVGLGDSIATDGVCLTVERKEGDRFVAVAGRETLGRTTLASAQPGRRVHLERALRVGDRLGGHLVQGHVDGVGRVSRAEPASESFVLWVDAPRELARYIAEKGSICIDGVSLTVNEVDGARFRVNIVPHTAQVTRVAGFRPGDAVNLEVDVIAKYVERLIGPFQSGGLTLQNLKDNGFVP